MASGIVLIFATQFRPTPIHRQQHRFIAWPKEHNLLRDLRSRRKLLAGPMALAYKHYIKHPFL